VIPKHVRVRILRSCFTSYEVASVLFVAICTFRRVLFRFLAFTGKVVSSAFDKFWGESAKLSFMTKILTSVALEWATQSSLVFYVYFEVEESC
jgi:hypothetical protein